MKQLIIWMCALFWAGRLVAAERLVPETFLTHCGVYRGTNSDLVRELTIETNKLWLAASVDQHSTSSGSLNWVAAPHWFVYVARDMRIWAYNGKEFFILLEANSSGSHSVPSKYLQETPPPAVMKRLPRAMRKSLSTNQASPPDRRQAAKGGY